MDLDERLGQMRAEPRAAARARHRVPLIADTAGIEAEWVGGRCLFLRRRPFRRDEPCLAVRREETAGGEKALATPLHWIERVVFRVRKSGQRADIEVASAVVFEARQRGVLAKHIG